jgi:hypothetical protein
MLVVEQAGRFIGVRQRMTLARRLVGAPCCPVIGFIALQLLRNISHLKALPRTILAIPGYSHD